MSLLKNYCKMFFMVAFIIIVIDSCAFHGSSYLHILVPTKMLKFGIVFIHMQWNNTLICSNEPKKYWLPLKIICLRSKVFLIYLKCKYLTFQVHLPSDLMCSGISPLFSSTGHNIELILQIELPLVASAFKMSGFTPAQVSS